MLRNNLRKQTKCATKIPYSTIKVNTAIELPKLQKSLCHVTETTP